MLRRLGRVRQVRRHAGLGQFIPYQLVDRVPDLIEHRLGDPLDGALAVRLEDQPLFRGHEQLGDIDVEDARDAAQRTGVGLSPVPDDRRQRVRT